MLPREKRLLALVCWLAAALPGQAQLEVEGVARLPRRDPPAAPVFSSDGSVVVRSPQSKAAYRMPVLTFVTQYTAELQRALRLKLGTQLCPVEVLIGGGEGGDRRVLTRRLRVGGGLVERIELPDPEAADLELLRRAVGMAQLRAWMVEAGGDEATMRDLPVWFIEGVLRSSRRETRQQDVDRTLLLWSRACLPPARELFAMRSVASTREPALAAVLAGWFLERREGVSLFEKVLREAAGGVEWSVERAALLLAGTEDLTLFDEFVDARLLAEGRTVIKAGQTSAGNVRRFRDSLLLFPPFFDKKFGGARNCCTLQEAAMRCDEPAIRASALAQATRVRMAALGRDGTLLAVAEAYASFLEALAQGDRQGELARKLLLCERQRQELEAATANGGVLRRE